MSDVSNISSMLQKRYAQNDETQLRPKIKDKAIQRESREKKDSWRKREAIQTGSTLTKDSVGIGNDTSHIGQYLGNNASRKAVASFELPRLVRYRLPPPQYSDYNGHRAPSMVPMDVIPGIGDYFSVNDHPMNRRGFRYSPCEASHLLPSLAYRGTEYEPFGPRLNFEDMNAQVYVDKEGQTITNPKGWRMARANVGVREGDWYYECKIVNGIGGISKETTESGHVRVGWARREELAPLDAPVGFDGYSYGLRDQSCQKIHLSRPKDFVLGVSFVTGDVIGLRIFLPSLAIQRELSGDPTVEASDIIRDRVPIRFKNQLWFEHFEYQPTKEFEDLMNPAPGSKPQHKPKALPGSFIKVYRNGEYIGTAFEELYAILPPASKPLSGVGGRELDDGTLGYYPAVSVFKGGAVRFNFGPKWIHPPSDMDLTVRSIAERYDEQIAEDVTYDIVDEVDLLFATNGIADVESKYANSGQGASVKEEIKEMVIDDE